MTFDMWMPLLAFSKSEISQFWGMAVGAVQTQDREWMASTQGLCSGWREDDRWEPDKEIEEKKQGEKFRECRHHGLAWQLTSSCPAQAQNLSPDKLEIMTLSLVFERARELNKGEKFTRQGKKRVTSQVMLIVLYVLVFLMAQRAQKRPSWSRASVSHLGVFFSPQRWRQEKMGWQQSSLIALSSPLSLFFPLSLGYLGHSYPKIYRHIKKKKKKSWGSNINQRDSPCSFWWQWC